MLNISNIYCFSRGLNHDCGDKTEAAMAASDLG